MEDQVASWTGEIVAYVVGFVSAWVKVLWTKVKGWFEANSPEDEDEFTGDQA